MIEAAVIMGILYFVIKEAVTIIAWLAFPPKKGKRP